MRIVLKQVLIQHKASSYHDQKVDIIIENGIITSIDSNINIEADQVVSGNNLVCTIGLCDIGTHAGEPGFEYIETMDSLTITALAGGYTMLALMPNLNPITQTKSDVEYLKNHPDRNGVDIYPIGALSKDTKGHDINEYMDMKSAGITCFSDGLHSIMDTGLLMRSLLYATHVDGVLVHFPGDENKVQDFDMHEGIMSTTLGLKGITDISEKSNLYRDHEVLKYTEGKILEHCLSSEGAIKLLKEFKSNTSNLNGSVAYLNLLFTEDVMSEFNTNYKVLPVLRSAKDKEALQKAVIEENIKIIVSNHQPWDGESKNLEFSYAKFGAIGLQTCFPAVIDEFTGKAPLITVIECFTIHPRNVLNVTLPNIELSQKANLCVIDLDKKWSFSEENNTSKSKNSPLLGHEFNCKVMATIHGEAAYFTT
ncbi:MAG: hypothetical protein R2774_15895 [Saprospiraceae bacterium]